MSDRRSDIQVGLFSIIGLLLLAMLILIFGGFKNVLVETYQVTALFENAAGTTQGTPVRLLGIEVGTVRDIALDQETGGVVMKLSIDRKVDIREGAPLSIKQEGFIANLYLEFGAGEGDGILPKDGSAVVSGRIDTFAAYVERAATVVADMGASLKERVGGLSERLAELAENVNGIVGDEKFREDFKGTMSNTRKVAAVLREKLPSLMDDLSRASGRAEEAIEKTAELLETYQGLGEELTQFSKRGTEQLARQGANLDRLTKSFIETADSIAVLSGNLNEVVEMVKAGDGTIGKFFADPELYRSLVDSIDEVEDASRMIGELAETLKRHPDWLLKGPPENQR